MAKLVLLLIVVAGVVGCSQETAKAEKDPAPAAASSGDSKAGTNSQLSLNPDYHK